MDSPRAEGFCKDFDHAFHDFADHRSLMGIANFGDAASNLAFLVLGVTGLVLFKKARLPAGSPSK